MQNVEKNYENHRENARFLLGRELERRCQQNPKYSLRAFARALGINAAMLSMVLSGKRNLSRKLAEKIATKLALNPAETNAFVRSVVAPKIQEVLGIQSGITSQQSYRDFALDQFAMIADWHHYAILSLIETKDFKPNFQWIASRLGISVMETKTAVERLERMDLLDTSKRRWRQIGNDIMIENEISTAATRKFQSQNLKLAEYSLENDSTKIRDISSVTMAIDPEDMPLAKEEIKKFKRYLMNLLEKKGRAKEVYHLAVQLYPVSRNRKE